MGIHRTPRPALLRPEARSQPHGRPHRRPRPGNTRDCAPRWASCWHGCQAPRLVYTRAALRPEPERGGRGERHECNARPWLSPPPILPQCKKGDPAWEVLLERPERRGECGRGPSSPLPPVPAPLPSSVAILGPPHKLNPVFQIGWRNVFAMLKSFPELYRETWGSRAAGQLACEWGALRRNWIPVKGRVCGGGGGGRRGIDECKKLN